jgi:hypothetical protein
MPDFSSVLHDRIWLVTGIHSGLVAEDTTRSHLWGHYGIGDVKMREFRESNLVQEIY